MAGCLPVGNYHSARTLNDGESSWGLTFSTTTYTDEDGDSLTIPGVIPEVTYHVGVADDVEVGGRVAPGFLYGEFDVKWRFVQSGPLHVALAPALGQMAAGITLTTFRFPVVMTYELNERIAINAGVNGTTWRLGSVSSDDGDSSLGFYSGDEVFVTSGFSLGLEISGKTSFFRPTFEWGTMVTNPDGNAERLKIGAVFLHFGFISGRELKKLEEMDEKLDRIEQRLGADNWNIRRKPTDG